MKHKVMSAELINNPNMVPIGTMVSLQYEYSASWFDGIYLGITLKEGVPALLWDHSMGKYSPEKRHELDSTLTWET